MSEYKKENIERAEKYKKGIAEIAKGAPSLEYDSMEDTLAHRHKVYINIYLIIRELQTRALLHDDSKMREPEKSIFDEFTPKLAETTYGSEEYKKHLSQMKIALDHHYANNRHHPEFHENGIKDMTLIDLVEMFCDWKAAAERHNDGDIMKSIEINQKRFGYGDELKQILMNTVKQENNY